MVAVIVDVGQMDDLEEVRARALNCGAIRAHVVDRRELFARAAIVPAVATPAPLDGESIRRLAHPVVAATLVEVAAIEGADAVAHAASHSLLDAAVARLAPALPLLAPARDWTASHVEPSDYVKAYRLPHSVVRPERNLLMRPASATAPDPDAAAFVTVGFEDGIAVAVNDVAMILPDLVESLSLIGGQYQLSAADTPSAPAALLLQAAYRASRGVGAVTLKLQAGSLSVVDASERRPVLVNQS